METLLVGVRPIVMQADDTGQFSRAREQEDSPDRLMTPRILYSGRLKNGKPTGWGVLMAESETGGTMLFYRGWWKNGRYHGPGRLKILGSSVSSMHRGFFRNGQLIGED